MRIVIKLAARDDVNVIAATRQIKRQIAKHLAGRGMVRKEEAIEEDDARHAARSPLSFPVALASAASRKH